MPCGVGDDAHRELLKILAFLRIWRPEKRECYFAFAKLYLLAASDIFCESYICLWQVLSGAVGDGAPDVPPFTDFFIFFVKTLDKRYCRVYNPL